MAEQETSTPPKQLGEIMTACATAGLARYLVRELGRFDAAAEFCRNVEKEVWNEAAATRQHPSQPE